MPGWSRIPLLLAALCCAGAQALSRYPEGCYDSHLGRYAADGETWTETGCVLSRCKVGRDGSAEVVHQNCAPQPYPDCVVSEEDSPADYPDCCPTWRCPSRCFSKSVKRWFSVGDEWTDAGCSQAHCTGTDEVRLLPCGLVRLTKPNCRIAPGNDTADYPGCCVSVQCDPEPGADKTCHDYGLDRHFAVGEEWTMSDCRGHARCEGFGAISLVHCPYLASNCRQLDDGQPSLPYPQCCPKMTCSDCYSQRLARYFGPGDAWTDDQCVQRQCTLGADGEVRVRRRLCELLDPPPYSDCEVVGHDLDRGDFPKCCSFYRCPGRCFSEGRWFSVGEVWTEGCTDPTQATCVGTGQVARLSCPSSRLDTTKLNCCIVDGNTDAGFPGC